MAKIRFLPDSSEVSKTERMASASPSRSARLSLRRAALGVMAGTETEAVVGALEGRVAGAVAGECEWVGNGCDVAGDAGPAGWACAQAANNAVTAPIMMYRIGALLGLPNRNTQDQYVRPASSFDHSTIARNDPRF